MAKKSTRAETAKRVNDVYDKLITGWSQPEIVTYGMKTWGVSEPAVRKYIIAANKSVAKFADEHRKSALQMHIVMRAYLYKSALEDGDKRLALEIARDWSKLLGLYIERSKVESQSINVDLTELTDDQLKRLVSGEDVSKVLAV